MVDTILVGLIVAVAAGYVLYRYVGRKSCGGSCGCDNKRNKGAGCCDKRGE